MTTPGDIYRWRKPPDDNVRNITPPCRLVS
jgi:hypothetical protein